MTDTHITAKTPSSRLDNIQDTIKNKLIEVGEIAKEENVDIILHGGDFFHTADVSNKFTGEIIEILKQYPVPIYTTIGNHDVYGYNINTLDNTKLGILQKANIINIVDRKNPLVFTENNYKIGIEAQEYYAHIDEGSPNDFKFYGDADCKILVTHSMLLDKDFLPNVKYTKIEDVCTNANVVLAGHYHPGWKEQIKDGVLFMNPGSLLRVDNSLSMQTLIPKVIILTVTKGNVSYKYRELKNVLPADKVFSTVNKEKVIYNNMLDDFNNKIKNLNVKNINILDIINEYEKSDPSSKIIVQLVKDELSTIQKETCIDKGYIASNENVYITSVKLKHFQAHNDREIVFDKGLNVIVGESNVGKTSILRAIEWVLYDTPKGNAFIRTGSRNCSVTLTLSNGCIIERKRSNSSSGSYILTVNGVKEEYKGFSNNIPIEILNSHQMPIITINNVKYKINIADQHDAPFMLGNSSNERLAMIGSLVDADRADMAKKNFNSKKIKLTNQKKLLNNTIEEAKEELKQYDYLDDLQKKIENLKNKITLYNLYAEKKKKIEKLFTDYLQNVEQLKEIEKKLKSFKIPNKELLNKYKIIIDNLTKIKKINSEYEDNIQALKDVNNKLKAVKLPNKELIEQYKCNIKIYNSLLRTYGALVTEQNKLKIVENKQKKISLEQKGLITSKDNCIKELKLEEHICPVCGNIMDIDKMLVR